jgi:two-component system phosphate regulon sensor histidine kinase PhoR
VLADSDEDPRMMENHSGRPEILEAMENEIGIAKRHSRTVGIPMLYVARRIDRDGQTSGILRIAVPVDEVEARTASTQKSIAIGTAAGLAFALLLGLFLARRFTRPIAEMTRVADDMRAGRYESRVRLHQQDEIGVLAETLNSLGREVTRRIATISQDDAQLRAMLAGMVEGVIAVEEDDTIGFCNAAARDLLGRNSRFSSMPSDRSRTAPELATSP